MPKAVCLRNRWGERNTVRRLIHLACHPAALVLVWLAAAAATGRADHDWLAVPFNLSVGAVVAGMLFLATGRAAFSIYVGWMLLGLLTAVSFLKFHYKGFSLHYYDVVFVLNDAEIHRFLMSAYLHAILPVFALLTLALGAAVLLFMADRRSAMPLGARVVMLGGAALLVPFTFPAEAAKDRYFYYMHGRHMSAFFVSLADLGHLFAMPDLEQRLGRLDPQEPFADIVDCGDGARHPDLFFVLEESHTDPANFPQVAGGRDFLERLAPSAGPALPLSVETFGGGTWITNLSLMTGLSSMDFAWRSPYLTVTLENHLRGALPEVLRRCGYRTAAILPLNDTFVNEGPFLRSIGFETVLDIRDIDAPSYHMRDDFYFRAAEAFVAKHRREDGRPLFLEIQTMYPHSPYGERFDPGFTVPGEPFGVAGEAAEYLRRMAVARGDFQRFLESRAAEASARPSVVMSFGDHQSSAMKPQIDALAGPDALSDPRSLAYRTFFDLTGFNHPLRRPSAGRPIDIAFLGATVLEAADLPLSPMMADLLRLRDRCAGAFYTCTDRGAIDRHLRRRVDSGMLRILPRAADAEAVLAW